MISLICPTRDRKEQFERMKKSALETAGCKIEILSGTNGGDDYVDYDFPQNIPTSYMWNKMAEKAKGNLIMLCADDVIFSTHGWGKALLDHYNKLEDKKHVYALQDSRDTYGTPHPIVSREFVHRLGYFVPPIFLHWFVDTWLVGIAKANNCFTHLREYSLVHDKPSDYGLADETHDRIRRNGWHMRDRYVNEVCMKYLQYEIERFSKTELV